MKKVLLMSISAILVVMMVGCSPTIIRANEETSEEVMQLTMLQSGNAGTQGERYTITAMIYPEDATNKAVDWILYFQDETDENPRDFIKIHQEKDGANTIELELLKRWSGSRMTLLCVSRDNPEATAEVNIGCVYTSFTPVYYDNRTESSTSYSTKELVFGFADLMNQYCNMVDVYWDGANGTDYPDFASADSGWMVNPTIMRLAKESDVYKQLTDEGKMMFESVEAVFAKTTPNTSGYTFYDLYDQVFNAYNILVGESMSDEMEAMREVVYAVTEDVQTTEGLFVLYSNVTYKNGVFLESEPFYIRIFEPVESVDVPNELIVF